VEMWSQMAAVVGVLLLAAAAVTLLRPGGARRFQARQFKWTRKQQRIEVVERVAADPRLSILVIRSLGAEWTLAVHNSGLEILDRRVVEISKAVE
jgi:hypothetical protein